MPFNVSGEMRRGDAKRKQRRLAGFPVLHLLCCNTALPYAWRRFWRGCPQNFLLCADPTIGPAEISRRVSVLSTIGEQVSATRCGSFRKLYRIGPLCSSRKVARLALGIWGRFQWQVIAGRADECEKSEGEPGLTKSLATGGLTIATAEGSNWAGSLEFHRWCRI